ncbi:hypothetical protein IVB12_02305 [Bradyrhizobium sp. 179]|uniref:hypothetical protein n=1 Tax=Bradyrhizobium sp. 179 TaxID=2782648 RepID=UPI001FFBD3CE|nr:hypothetical protein [Bradyrhizobium sp. 179]MCK1540854.1 hypothetical protein [Bradyrhizobium sp. 179]
MRYLILLLAVFAAAARTDDAKPLDPADYPPGVQKALRCANEDCDNQDGGAVTLVCVQEAVGQARGRRPCGGAFDRDKWAAMSGQITCCPHSKRKPDAAPAHVPPCHESRLHADPECAAAWIATWLCLG